jgi:hypothetical protein
LVRDRVYRDEWLDGVLFVRRRLLGWLVLTGACRGGRGDGEEGRDMGVERGR